MIILIIPDFDAEIVHPKNIVYYTYNQSKQFEYDETELHRKNSCFYIFSDESLTASVH